MSVRDGMGQQAELYGAPLAETVGHVTGSLGLSQSRVAKVLGMSAPMLSQLVTGSRVKIGSPRSLARLRSLVLLATEVDGGLGRVQIEPRLAVIAQQSMETLTRPASRGPDAQSAALATQRLLRAVASGKELRQAAALLQPEHPELATLLLVHGTGSESEAEAHFRETTS